MESTFVRELEIVYKSRRKIQKNNIVDNPTLVAKFVTKLLGKKIQENFAVLLLSPGMEVTGWITAAIGTIQYCMVHPREIFRAAIIANASSIIVAHNHPSGATYPSKEDIEATKKLVEAGKLIGIQVLDHVIVGNVATSLREAGYF